MSNIPKPKIYLDPPKKTYVNDLHIKVPRRGSVLDRNLAINGEVKTLREWCQFHDVDTDAVRMRWKRGVRGEDLFTVNSRVRLHYTPNRAPTPPINVTNPQPEPCELEPQPKPDPLVIGPPKPPKPYDGFVVRLPVEPDLYVRYMQRAAEQGVTVKEMMHRALRDYDNAVD